MYLTCFIDFYIYGLHIFIYRCGLLLRLFMVTSYNTIIYAKNIEKLSNCIYFLKHWPLAGALNRGGGGRTPPKF